MTKLKKGFSFNLILDYLAELKFKTVYLYYLQSPTT